MASHCYLVGPSGELFVEYLVKHCALPDQDRNELGTSKEVFGSSGTYVPSQCKRSEVKIGAVCPTELGAICEKGLLLLTITIPEIEHILWPFLLKMIIPRDYIGAAATVRLFLQLVAYSLFADVFQNYVGIDYLIVIICVVSVRLILIYQILRSF